MAGSCFNLLSKASWPGGPEEASFRADIQDYLPAAISALPFFSDLSHLLTTSKTDHFLVIFFYIDACNFT